MEFQNVKRAIKVVYGHFVSESSDNEHRKQLHVIYGCSWDITSRRVIKMLRRAVATAAPASRAMPHHKWMETSIACDASDYPKSMPGPGSSRWSSPRPSPTSGCTTSN
jgi:hypothetical protein